MKKIKKTKINQEKLITKSEYARINRTNPTQVRRLIEKGELTVVPILGGEIIHL